MTEIFFRLHSLVTGRWTLDTPSHALAHCNLLHMESRHLTSSLCQSPRASYAQQPCCCACKIEQLTASCQQQQHSYDYVCSTCRSLRAHKARLRQEATDLRYNKIGQQQLRRLSNAFTTPTLPPTKLSTATTTTTPSFKNADARGPIYWCCCGHTCVFPPGGPPSGRSFNNNNTM